jgi:hypothetical protein
VKGKRRRERKEREGKKVREEREKVQANRIEKNLNLVNLDLKLLINPFDYRSTASK